MMSQGRRPIVCAAMLRAVALRQIFHTVYAWDPFLRPHHKPIPSIEGAFERTPTCPLLRSRRLRSQLRLLAVDPAVAGARRS